MATRVYLPSSGAAPVTPSTWNMPYQAATTYTLGGLTKKGTTAFTSRTTAGGTTSGRHIGVMRYVIGPLTAVEISGTVNACLRVSESSSSANTTMAIAVKLIKPDGTDRSVLLAYTASDSAASPREFTTSLNNKRAYNVSETRPIPLTAQTPTDGDYLVIEIGFRYGSTTSYNIVLRHGDNSANDLADADSGTNDYAPWVDFSVTLPLKRRGQVSWAELEIPAEARRGRVSWAELETPNLLPIRFVKSNTSTGSDTVALTGITAGNLIVLLCKWEAATSGTLSVTDGTTTLDLGTRRNYSTDGSIQVAYLLSANGGDKTFTVTWPSGATYKALMIYEFVHDNTLVFDAENGTEGDSTTPNSGNISTGSVNSIVFGGEFSYPGVPSTLNIGGEAPDDELYISSGSEYVKFSRRIYAASKSNIAANCTVDPTCGWICSITSFKETAGAYTLNLDPGSYSVSGQTAGILAQRLLDAAPGSYGVTGQAAALNRGYVINADGGVYQITGVQAGILAQRLLNGDAGSYLITGQAADALAQRLLDAAPGEYSLAGFLADLVHGTMGAYVLNLDPGSYLIVGKDADLIATRSFNAEPGVYQLTGVQTGLLVQRLLDAEAGNYILTGNNAELVPPAGLPGLYGHFGLRNPSIVGG